MKRINVSLTKDGSIQRAIKELEAYKQSLRSKSDIFVEKLALLGVPVIDERIAQAAGDSDKSHYTHIKIRSFGDYSEAVLEVQGKDILFLEFGAGIHYNTAAGTSPHPKGAEFGYTIGSYGLGQGAKDYWFYTADTGESIMSHGTQATMPMYSAEMEIIDKIHKIAKEVFNG